MSQDMSFLSWRKAANVVMVELAQAPITSDIRV
jgi:hypothetical protein